MKRYVTLICLVGVVGIASATAGRADWRMRISKGPVTQEYVLANVDSLGFDEEGCGPIEQPAGWNVARFGYYWKNQSLPYDTEIAYTYDMAVYPEGIYADECDHQFVYVTSQNKHIAYGDMTYGVEVVGQYGYGTNNTGSIKRIWIAGYNDPNRYSSPWIDSDAGGVDWFGMDTLENEGYLTVVDGTKFLRVRIQTILTGEQSSPVSSTWENRIWFFSFGQADWVLKAKSVFTIAASRQVVRDATYAAGSGIWSCILETYGDQPSAPGSGAPPVKAVTFRNRSVRVVDGGVSHEPSLDASNNNWIAPGYPYTLFDRSTPTFVGYSAGTDLSGARSGFFPAVVQGWGGRSFEEGVEAGQVGGPRVTMKAR